MACAISMHRSALEVDQKSRDRAVTVTFKSAVHAAMMGNSWSGVRKALIQCLGYVLRYMADLRPGAVKSASGRRLTDIWIVWVVQNCARCSPDVCDALTDIDQASTDLLAIRLR